MLGQCLWLWMNKYSWGHGQKQNRGQKQNHVCILHHTHDENSPFFSQNLYKKIVTVLDGGIHTVIIIPFRVHLMLMFWNVVLITWLIQRLWMGQNKKRLFLESSCL